MSWLSKLLGLDAFSKAMKPDEPKDGAQDEADLIAAFCADLGGDARGASTAFSGIEALLEDGLLKSVDWTAGPNDILANLSAFFEGAQALPAQAVATVRDIGAKAGEKGRGHAALPSICALDDVLKTTGTRLLWIDTGGDSYDLARTPDAVWSKWYDVKIGNVALLEADMRNEYPNKRSLVMEPR